MNVISNKKMVCYDVSKLLDLLDPYAPDLFLQYKQQVFTVLSDYAYRANKVYIPAFRIHLDDDDESEPEEEPEVPINNLMLPASYLVSEKNFSYSEALFIAAVSAVYDEWKNSLVAGMPIEKKFEWLIAYLDSDLEDLNSGDYDANILQVMLNAIKLFDTDEPLFNIVPNDLMFQQIAERNALRRRFPAGEPFERFVAFPKLRKGQRLSKQYGTKPKHIAVIEALQSDTPVTKLTKSIASDVQAVVLVST